MGFLIFAYRKLFLKRKINDLNYQAMALSQRKQEITNQIGNVQQAMASAKNVINIFTSTSLSAIQTSALTDNYTKNDKGGYKLKDGVSQTDLYNTINEKQQAILAGSQIANSIFETANTSQLNQLNAIDSQISLQLANIDSQTQQLVPELQAVEKAEGEAAKSEAPKFGLG